MSITGKNIIGYSESAKGASFQVQSPSTGELLANTYFTATSEEVDEAMNKANAASKAYSKVSRKNRAQFLRDIADNIAGSAETLTPIAMAESGLPQGRIEGETGRTCNQLRLFANLIEEGSYVKAVIDKGNPDRTPLPKPDLRSMEVALGPVVVFGASNFPLAFSTGGGDTASALAAGCPVVVKGHPAHPGTSEIVAQAIIAAAKKNDLPDGVFSLLFDSGIEVGIQLTNHKYTKAVGFTGSLKAGRSLMNIAAKRENPIPVYAEMGSVNPSVILPGTLKDKADALATGMAGSVTMGVGQFCTNPGIVFGIKDENWDQFCATLSTELGNVASGTMLTQGISNTYHKGIQQISADANIEVLLSAASSDTCQAGPSLLRTSSEALRNNPKLGDEIFGPSTLLVDCDSMEDVLKTVASLDGQLTASIHGNEDDVQNSGELVDILTELAGRVIFNGFPTGVDLAAAMIHGGPYPASSDGRSTSVGVQAVYRFTRPVSYQELPQSLLPLELQDANPLNVFQALGTPTATN
ncbi:MAG: aldehyde dehydrogenase (NADP(+)) [Flavobacteriales bacterium]|nr:aldehyde dehydrogenase (NADP(+)) [Flavobacteriales bacterium]